MPTGDLFPARKHSAARPFEMLNGPFKEQEYEHQYLDSRNMIVVVLNCRDAQEKSTGSLTTETEGRLNLQR